MAYLRRILTKHVSMKSSWNRFSSSCPITFSAEVQQAKLDGKPIVALESTIITHGMPYPQNLQTATQVEEIIRKRGAIPATVAILKGDLTVGLNKEQLEYLAQAKGVVKASRRDLAPVAAARLDGATTVAGTIIAAELAGIPVFVTGGIGGVHREGETTMDVSADLRELGRSRTLVVCSGVKSVLDIPRTLEYLETEGVCVCAFGETYDFPAFYTRRSGQLAPHRVSDANHAASVLLASTELQLASGIVVAVPVPEQYAMDDAVIEKAIQKALGEAKEKGIKGKEVTPFILAAVASATGGKSLAANIALIKNNAKVGADIAVEFHKLKNVRNSGNIYNIGAAKSGRLTPDLTSSRRFHTSACRCQWERKSEGNESTLFDPKKCAGDVLVIGGANVDRTYRVIEDAVLLDGSTHASSMVTSAGGVGRNMAEALWRLSSGRTKLLTAIGDDSDGEYLAGIAPGLILDGCKVQNGHTSTYAAVLDSTGECRLGLGDMTLHNHITIDLVNRHMKILELSPLVVLDGNVPQATIDHVLNICHQLNKPVFFEPTDRRKSIKTLQNEHKIMFASPNLNELRAMAFYIDANQSLISTSKTDEIATYSKFVLKHVKTLIVTMGVEGVFLVKLKNDKPDVHHYPVQALSEIESVSGAGDCFASGFIHGYISGLNEEEIIATAFKCARAALKCKQAVPLSFD